MTFVFLFACAVFACDRQTIAGDGRYYETKAACLAAARGFAAKRRINLVRFETMCIEGERPP